MSEFIDTFSKVILVDVISQSLIAASQKIISSIKTKTDKKAVSEAITAIQFATIKTRNFISENGYQKNEDLTKLWHEAFNKVITAKIDDNLPEYLYQKARFWGQPKNWLDNPDTLELVPKLNLLDENVKCY